MNKENKVFVAKPIKKIINNKSMFSTIENKNIKERKVNNKNIHQKIYEIFNSRNYVYKADLIIYTKTSELKKRIIGKNSNYLITNENELIPISEIVDIDYQ